MIWKTLDMRKHQIPTECNTIYYIYYVSYIECVPTYIKVYCQ